MKLKRYTTNLMLNNSTKNLKNRIVIIFASENRDFYFEKELTL